jgi:hypothetical protein
VLFGHQPILADNYNNVNNEMTIDNITPLCYNICIMNEDRIPGPIDMPLWYACQRAVYPKRSPSDHPPFAHACPEHRTASWLYQTLSTNPGLRRALNLGTVR